MTNNAPVYWEVQKADGTWFSLNTYCWSVKSYGGRRFLAGAKRGEDLHVPYRRGRIYVPKSRESQLYDMNMWVFPLTESGAKDGTKTLEQKAHENWRKIIAAVDQEGQFRLRKRWHMDTSVRADFGSQTHVQAAVGLVEYMDGTGPDTDDGHGFYTNLSLAMPDPYFYSNQLIDGYTAAAKAAAATSMTVPGVTTINPALGEAPTDHVWISIVNAGSSNPKITFPDGNWIKLNTASMPNPNAEVVIDCHKGVVVVCTLANYLADNLGATPLYLNGLISRNTSFLTWPTIDPVKYPSSAFTTALDTGSATIKLVYDPAYR